MAAREGWEVVAEYADNAASAYSGSRGPELAAAKQHAARLAAEQGTAVLVVQHSDRLARGDGVTAPQLIQHSWDAQRDGYAIRSVQDDATFTEQSGLMAFVMGLRNHEDSKRKSAATKAGVRRRAERGRYGGGYAPYGLRHERDRNDAADPGRLVRDPAQAEVVRRIYAACLAGLSDRRIMRDLDADSITPPRAKRWDKRTVSNILGNPIYVGRVRIHGEEFGSESVEPIFDLATWEAVQRLRAARAQTTSKGRGRPTSGSHLFVGGLLRCGLCGGAMRPRTYRRGKEKQVYLCATRDGGGTCRTSAIERASVDEAVLGYFEQVALDVEATRDQLAGATERRLAEARALREQGERELAKAEQRLERVRRDYADGRLDAEEWHEFRHELGAEREAAQAKLDLLRERELEADAEAAARDLEGELLDRLTALRAAVAGQFGSGDLPAVRAALQALFEGFILRRLDEGDEPVELDLCLGDLYIEPRLRADAIEGFEPVYAEDSARTLTRPVLRPAGLALGAETKATAAPRSALDRTHFCESVRRL
jgi:DNA invertase Pin-like site-specific DNA recombinase